MSEIHLIKKDPSLPQITPQTGEGPDIFRSGYWRIAEATAQKLIGGKIFFHKTWAQPSFCGGVIMRTEKMRPCDMYPGRTVFIFKRDQACKSGPISGCYSEKKII